MEVFLPFACVGVSGIGMPYWKGMSFRVEDILIEADEVRIVGEEQVEIL